MIRMTEGKKVTYVDLPADETIHHAYETALEQVQAELGTSHPIFCAGEELFAGSEFDVISPFDARILVGKFQEGGEEHIRSVVTAAKEGFSSWQCRDWRERAGILRRCADHLDARKFLLSALITYECGKNRYEALAEVSEAVDMIRYYVDLYEKNEGYILSMAPESNTATCRSVMHPHGVFVVISPFNFPLALAAGMASAALITGNTVILKPTSTAPWSALRLYEAFISGGVPPTAVQYITGPGEIFGKTIVAHQDIDGIAFTGSRHVGMWLQRTFAAMQPYPKPVILEMGSKNPVIVTAQADMAKAVKGVVKAAFGYSGQKCSAASRIYLEEPVAERFMTELKKQVENLSIGDPRNRNTVIGPVIDRKAVVTFRDAVARTRKDGGRIITGGNVLRGGEFDRGYYVQPTVVTGLPADHPLNQRELFVPFIIIGTFSTLAEALQQTNATEYGLTAGIFSGQDDEVEYFFSNIRFGVTYANRQDGATTGAWPGSQSFAGWKASGSTGKGVGGPYYLLSFLREQAQTRIHAPPV
jgi:1-pyrroline-5-carboxylate dehydrogenase